MYTGDLADYHDAHAGDLARAGAQTLVAQLRGNGVTRGRIVDIGCGGGISLEVFREAGYAVTGVDPSPDMLRLAAARVPDAELVQATAAQVRLPEGAVGIVALNETLAYDLTIDLDELLEACHAALRPGGLVLLDLPGPGRHGPDGDSWEAHERQGSFLAVHTTTDRMRLTRRVTLFTHRGRGSYRRHRETHEMRLYPSQDISAGLARAGFVAIRQLPRYGDAEIAFGEHWSAFSAVRP